MLDLERQFIRQVIAHKCGMNTLRIVRHIQEWKQSQRKGQASITDRRPWLTFEATHCIARRLRRGDSVFEYGGGGSTLYCLDRGAKVVTVEHDREWYDKLCATIACDGLEAQWQGIYAPPEDAGSSTEVSRNEPDGFTSSSPQYRGKTFKKYVMSIDRFPDNSFDFVIIDGRARQSCLSHAVGKVKAGGYLVLDNTERAYLTPEISRLFGQYQLLLDTIGPSPYVDFFTRTHIWVRLG